MARKVVLVSDLSGQDIPEDGQVEVRVLEHPGLSQPVRLDASSAETDRLKLETKPMSLLELVLPDGQIERIAVDAALFAKSIKGDADEVLANAEGLRFSAPTAAEPEAPRRGRRPRSDSAPTSATEKIDYTAEDRYGQLHRGRLTDEEIKLVKANPGRASANREAQGHPPIDWSDAKERSRYNLSEEDLEEIKKYFAD